MKAVKFCGCPGGGTGVADGIGVAVGIGVLVGGIGVSVGTGVSVGGIGVAVGTGVSVGGIGVAVGSTSTRTKFDRWLLAPSPDGFDTVGMAAGVGNACVREGGGIAAGIGHVSR